MRTTPTKRSLNLSRNLGLITGASVMGSVFAAGAASANLIAARPDAVAAGMPATFAVAAVLAGTAVVITAVSQAAARRKD